jgi:hypothetical protein
VADSVELKIGRSAMRMCELKSRPELEGYTGESLKGSILLAGGEHHVENSAGLGLEASAGVRNRAEPPAAVLPGEGGGDAGRMTATVQEAAFNVALTGMEGAFSAAYGFGGLVREWAGGVGSSFKTVATKYQAVVLRLSGSFFRN